jgi:hypothetical protein
MTTVKTNQNKSGEIFIMKKQLLALAVLGTAALGNAILSAPAHAQIVAPGAPNQNITVSVSVPEILYLRTIPNAIVNLAGTDFAPGLVAVGSNYIGRDYKATANGTVDTTSPFTTGTVQKTISQAYAVWSNSPRANGVNIAITTPSTYTNTVSNGTINVAIPASSSRTGVPATGLITPITGDIALSVTPTSTTTPGTYFGNVNVAVSAP